MRLVRVTALVAALTAASTASALACSCAFLPAETLHQNAAAIFTGVVTSTRPAQPGYSMTTFAVTESFKGVVKGTRVSVAPSQRLVGLMRRPVLARRDLHALGDASATERCRRTSARHCASGRTAPRR